MYDACFDPVGVKSSAILVCANKDFDNGSYVRVDRRPLLGAEFYRKTGFFHSVAHDVNGDSFVSLTSDNGVEIRLYGDADYNFEHKSDNVVKYDAYLVDVVADGRKTLGDLKQKGSCVARWNSAKSRNFEYAAETAISTFSDLMQNVDASAVEALGYDYNKFADTLKQGANAIRHSQIEYLNTINDPKYRDRIHPSCLDRFDEMRDRCNKSVGWHPPFEGSFVDFMQDKMREATEANNRRLPDVDISSKSQDASLELPFA